MLQKTSRGLFILLLMVMEWSQPSLPYPMKPLCDLKVLNPYIKEATDAEIAMRSCREECSLSESVTIPQPGMAFDVWGKKNVEDQAHEVQSGLWMLRQALGLLQVSVSNTALRSHRDNSISNLVTITNLLRSLNIQEYTPPASIVGGEDTRTASSAPDLFQVQASFLRGKVRRLLSKAPACQQQQQHIS